jgi:hypothetical protein
LEGSHALLIATHNFAVDYTGTFIFDADNKATFRPQRHGVSVKIVLACAPKDDARRPPAVGAAAAAPIEITRTWVMLLDIAATGANCQTWKKWHGRAVSTPNMRHGARDVDADRDKGPREAITIYDNA